MLEYQNALSLIQFVIKLDVLWEARQVNSLIDVIREEREGACGVMKVYWFAQSPKLRTGSNVDLS